MTDKRLIVGCDHAGFELKSALIEAARELGCDIEDVGTHDLQSADYPDYGHLVARAVQEGRGTGLLVCGSGIGMSMTANRHAGVRAALCCDAHAAKMARAHNNANVLCIGARTIEADQAVEILRTFLTEPFEGGRHERRVAKIEV